MRNKLIEDILKETPDHLKKVASDYADSLLKMDEYHQRKQKRKEHFEQNVKGHKQQPCGACNGSGYYDHNGSPKCGACKGTGKEIVKPGTK